MTFRVKEALLSRRCLAARNLSARDTTVPFDNIVNSWIE